MDFIEDCMESILACFHRKPDDESTNRSARQPLFYLDPLSFLDDGKLEKDFEKLVEECGLSEERRAELRLYSREKKLVMLNTHTFRPEEDCGKLISLLRTYVQDTPELVVPSVSSLQDLVITLRTQCSSFVEQFVSEDGVRLLCSLLLRCQLIARREPEVQCLLGAFRALLNSTKGRVAVLQDDEALLAIARTIDLRDCKCKILAVEILSGLCFVPEDGHRKVLNALTQVSTVLGERTRFQTLVSELHRSCNSEKETDRSRTAILGLVNALLRTGHAESSLEFRVHLRCEFLMLGMAQAAALIRPEASNRLLDHLDLFEMMRKEDEIVLSGGSSEDSGASSPVNFENATDIAEALQNKLKSSPALPHFMSLLQHLFMVPSDEKHLPLWRLFDLILQHLTLQATVRGMSDVDESFSSVVDMEEILTRLRTQCDYERLETEVERMKEELDHERMRAMELDNRIADLSDGRDSVSSGISTLSTSPSDPCPSMSPLPPICPPTPAPPPPPPLGLAAVRSNENQKRVPKPTGPLKTFNWLKLSEAKVKGTAWEFIEDEKMYKQLDLEHIATTFASSSQKEDENDFYNTISRRTRDTQISVIDPRRYQNCTIMLSKLKLSHREIRNALMAMDDKGKLPKDMLEQMLKFVPSKEEVTLLRNTVSRHNSPSILALADRYLYEMAQIPRFEQRLRSLHIIRTFQERFDSLIPYIQSVTKASTALSSSKKFKQLLALVLAVGNHLNYGKRNGNAFGFDLSSLNRLSDVKFAHRSDRNLLHYVLQVLENRLPELTKLRRELAVVYDAARYNRNEVLAEIHSLEQSIAAVRAELAFLKDSATAQQTQDQISEEEHKKDRFEDVAKQFVATACEQFHQLEKQHSEMKAKFSACAAQFCFDTVNPEELFSCLAKFLTAFCDAQQQLWTENEQKEQVKRQTLARSYFAKKTSRRRENERDFDQLISALQSGDLFKDDLSRLRTSFRVPKKTRVKL
ncbi:hypothetical protein Q1695_002242 [Nippostrongylus brasiliensis]|nr:hypothetical protein Q1695_002242 [Nippostrongylus brasiliensis]